MPAVTYKIRGLDKVHRGIRRVPKNTMDAVYGVLEETAKFIQKSAKLRARRWTGQLAEGIRVKKARKYYMVESEAPYGWFQEYGFRRHWVHLSMPTRSGFTLRDWLASKYPDVLVRNPKLQFIRVGGLPSSFRPHIRPAIEKGLSRQVQSLPRKVYNALVRSFR